MDIIPQNPEKRKKIKNKKLVPAQCFLLYLLLRFPLLDSKRNRLSLKCFKKMNHNQNKVTYPSMAW
jgi:hypothetical protein